MLKVDNAVILAAGFGSRFAPLTYSVPKGLVKVKGERMVERQIVQLHEKSITDITIAVGHLKEKFQYLKEKYGVKLVFCPDYNEKNNLSTLHRIRHLLKNTYVLSSDNYITENVFSISEESSWYCAVEAEGHTDEWCMEINGEGRIVEVRKGGFDSWHMYGPVFFDETFSREFVPLLEDVFLRDDSASLYWEDVLIENLDKLKMYANKKPEGIIHEFESLEELRGFDDRYRTNSGDYVIAAICGHFGCAEDEIKSITPFGKGMTNNSFAFTVPGGRYVCRVPGKGTSVMIDRFRETENLRQAGKLGISEICVFGDAVTGIKISRYEDFLRNADPNRLADTKRCMDLLRALHYSGVSVKHRFKADETIALYAGLCRERGIDIYGEIPSLRESVDRLSGILERVRVPEVFCHIDCICDNFLMLRDGGVKLIDWEYAAMCDPASDLAMFSLYSLFDIEDVESLMKMYYERKATDEEKLRVYAFMALGGFLWSVWARYMETHGRRFGDYAEAMHGCALEYFARSIEIDNIS